MSEAGFVDWTELRYERCRLIVGGLPRRPGAVRG